MDWWLKDKGFQNLVAHKWGNYHPCGWGGYVLMQKLKFIKVCIRHCWSLSNGVINARKIQNLKMESNVLEAGINDRTLSQAEVELKKYLQDQLWNAAYAFVILLLLLLIYFCIFTHVLNLELNLKFIIVEKLR